ncbi:class I SAM-dependent methyltransferase [Streptomyces rimosus]|uniref:class I SAM-dependent methyltransferase n=1 Tax=Streptomyces rimosus TaxID=1927 RepID=UPI00067D8605|nr:class I SAM-dependent methyltransferase [Streptomyces rimosus]
MSAQPEGPAPDSALTAYEAVAADYDTIVEDPYLLRWITFYRKLAERYGPAGTRLLDAGCGTGRGTLALRDRFGYTVTGCDLSPQMIEAARAKPEAAGVPFHVADLREMPDLGSFDVVTCMGEPLAYLSGEELAGAFAGLGRQLADDGVLVFDMTTLGSFRRDYAVTKVADRDGRFDVWRGGPVPVEPDTVVDVTHDYFARTGEDTWRRISSRHLYHHHSDATVRGRLAAAGLRLIAAHGVEGRKLTDVPDEDACRKILYVAGKQPE